jgi:hypothetical protein
MFPITTTCRVISKSTPYVLRGAGEYEIGGTFLMGIPLHDIQNDEGGIEHRLIWFNTRRECVASWRFRAHPPSSLSQSIGDVHVLLVPVGGGNTLSAAQAAEIISRIEPNYVIPMHYALSRFDGWLGRGGTLLERCMGTSSASTLDTLKVNGEALPEEMEVVLLQASIE